MRQDGIDSSLGQVQKTSRAWIACLCGALVMMMACDKTPSTPAEPQEVAQDQGVSQEVATRVAAPKSERVVAHSATIPADPVRVVSLAPNITELMFALGKGDSVVGVTRFCDEPADKIKDIKKVGGFIDPDMEAILSLEPDLVVGMQAGDPKLVQKLEQATIPYVFMKMDDLEQTLEGIEVLGEVVGARDKATTLSGALKDALRPVDKKPEQARTLFLMGHDPMVAAGHGTFAHDLIERAGGKNVIDANKGSYVTIDMEYVLKSNPDVILDATMTGDKSDSIQSFWQPYSDLAAVKRSQVHHLENPSLLRPGPRLDEAYTIIKTIFGKLK